MNTNFEKAREFWGKEIVRGNLIYANVDVIRFVKRNMVQGDIILDFGCGAGRDSIALSMEGYKCIAMDYTEEALKLIKHKISGTSLEIDVVQNMGIEVPLAENCVDGIIADGSLFLNKKSDIIILLKNLKKCLKPGGKIWTNWRTKSDSLYKQGVSLGEGLYELGPGTKREGACYFFADEQDITDIFENAGLIIESVDNFDYTENNKNTNSSWFHVIAKK